LRRECAGSIEFVSRVPEFELTRQYSWADIFLFPTIEDGFGVVVAQAQASGLPIVASAHSGGPDLITPGVNGQIVPIRSPEVILDTLLAWDRDRALLKRMTEASCEAPVARDWSGMAIDLENRFGARAVGMAAVSGG
jgi:glycosyltransferase involved in cell wall biosynthesis